MAYAVSTMSVSLVLFLLGAVAYFIVNAYGSSMAIRENVSLTVILADNISIEGRAGVERRLKENPAVKSVKYTDKESAAKEFAEYLGRNFVDFLSQNPIPASFDVTFNGESADTEVLKQIEKEAATWNGVENVIYQAKIVDAVVDNIRRLNLILMIFGGTLLVVSLLLVSNTLRLAVHSKRANIGTMKLVGATHSFIRKPFINSAFAQGATAGLISCGLLAATIVALQEGIPDVRFVDSIEVLVVIFGGMFVLGVTMCVVFTHFAVNRYIRTNSTQLFY